MGLWDRFKSVFGGDEISTPLTVTARPKAQQPKPSPEEEELSNMKTPIMGVIPRDEMLRAEQEARARFPEFASAFERRQDGQTFFIKAPFGPADAREYLWIDVELITDANIRGTITSDPKRPIGYRAGDTVNVRASEISDWTYSEGKTRLGGFTIAVLKNAGVDE